MFLYSYSSSKERMVITRVYLISFPPLKLPGLAKNILYVKYAILLTFDCNDVSPYFSSSDPAVLMHYVVSVL